MFPTPNAINVILTMKAGLASFEGIMIRSAVPEMALIQKPIQTKPKKRSSGASGSCSEKPSTRISMAAVKPTRMPRPSVCRNRIVGYAHTDSDSRIHTAGPVVLSHVRRLMSMRRLAQRLPQDEPRVAVAARAAGKRRRESQIQRGNLPSLLRAPRLHDHAIRPQQVVGRRVVAMLVLDALEDRKFIARAHVQLEAADPVDDVVIDALRVMTVILAARLPAAFQDVAGVV